MNQYPGPWREPTTDELAIITKAADASKNPIYLLQVCALEVRTFDIEEQLGLKPSDGAPLDQTRVEDNAYLLSEGIYLDEDGQSVSVLLHGGAGKLRFLELYKGGEDPVLNRRCSVDKIVWL